MQTFKDTQTNQVWQFEDDVLIKEGRQPSAVLRAHQLEKPLDVPATLEPFDIEEFRLAQGDPWRGRAPARNISRPPLPVLTSQVRAGASSRARPSFRIPADWR